MGYWFDETGYAVQPMKLKKGNYILEIEIPESAKSLHYSISVRDDNNNSEFLDNTLNIIDNIPPELKRF